MNCDAIEEFSAGEEKQGVWRQQRWQQQRQWRKSVEKFWEHCFGIFCFKVFGDGEAKKEKKILSRIDDKIDSSNSGREGDQGNWDQGNFSRTKMVVNLGDIFKVYQG